MKIRREVGDVECDGCGVLFSRLYEAEDRVQLSWLDASGNGGMIDWCKSCFQEAQVAARKRR